MKKIHCAACGMDWYPQRLAHCPRCLARRWLSAPGLVSEPHDAPSPPESFPCIRSALSIEMLDDEGVFFFYAAAHGTAYHLPDQRNYLYFVPNPIGVMPGFAAPANEPVPAYATDRLLILDAFGPAPRAYTCDLHEFEREVDAGRYVPLPACDEPGCQNLSQPYLKKCIEHG